MKTIKYGQGRFPLFLFSTASPVKRVSVWRLRIWDSKTMKGTAQECHHQLSRVGKKTEVERRKKQEKQIIGQREPRSREWDSSVREVHFHASIAFSHLLCASVWHQCGLTLCSTEGDEMQLWTEWIINVKISFSTQSNKLPMIWLSERLVAWIRETPGSHGAMSSPPWVIDSSTLSTFWSWWLREPGPDWSPESGSSRWVTGPHSKPILCDLCPQHRAVVNPHLSDLENTDRCIDVDAESYWRADWTDVPSAPLLLPSAVFLTLSVSIWLLQGI